MLKLHFLGSPLHLCMPLAPRKKSASVALLFLLLLHWCNLLPAVGIIHFGEARAITGAEVSPVGVPSVDLSGDEIYSPNGAASYTFSLVAASDGLTATSQPTSFLFDGGGIGGTGGSGNFASKLIIKGCDPASWRLNLHPEQSLRASQFGPSNNNCLRKLPPTLVTVRNIRMLHRGGSFPLFLRPETTPPRHF